MRQKLRRIGRDRLQFARPHINDFVNWLHRQGYATCSIQNLRYYLGGWAEWAAGHGFDINTVDRALVASEFFIKKKHRRRPGQINQKSIGAGRLFIRHLRESGVVSPPRAPLNPTDRWPRLREFRC